MVFTKVTKFQRISDKLLHKNNIQLPKDLHSVNYWVNFYAINYLLIIYSFTVTKTFKKKYELAKCITYKLYVEVWKYNQKCFKYSHSILYLAHHYPPL